jgi:amino acid transporter
MGSACRWCTEPACNVAKLFRHLNLPIASERVESGRLHRRLSSFGVLLLTLSCLSPVLSIYGVGSDVIAHAGTGAADLFLIGIVAAAIWSLVYSELGSAYPYAGGDYVGVGTILGPAAGFACLTVWAVTSGPATGFLAQVVGTYVREIVPGVSPALVTFGSLAAATIIALLAVRTSAIVTGLFLLLEMLAVVALVIAGLWHPAHTLTSLLARPMMLGPRHALVPVAIGTMALEAVSAAYATVGGNQAIGFGEELQDPQRRMGGVILIAGLIGALATAVPVIAVVLGTRNPSVIFASAAPLSAFIVSVAGPAAGHALSAGVALACFNALIAQIMFSARLFFSLGRDRIFPASLSALLAHVHRPSGAPRMATLAVSLFAAACCFLSSHLLLVFTTGLVVYGFALASLAVLVGRLRGLTGREGCWRTPLFPLAPILGLAAAAVFALADLLDADVGRPTLLALGLVIVAALVWHQLVLKRRGWRPRIEPGGNGRPFPGPP